MKLHSETARFVVFKIIALNALLCKLTKGLRERGGRKREREREREAQA